MSAMSLSWFYPFPSKKSKIMFKKAISLGVISGLLAGIASLIYQKVYASSLGEDFGSIVKPLGIISISLFAGLLAGSMYTLFTKWFKDKGEIVFNLVFVIFSFASILAPFAIKLPFDIETPELFPGLIVPIHFFPALAWFTLRPLFLKMYPSFNRIFA